MTITALMLQSWAFCARSCWPGCLVCGFQGLDAASARRREGGGGMSSAILRHRAAPPRRLLGDVLARYHCCLQRLLLPPRWPPAGRARLTGPLLAWEGGLGVRRRAWSQ